MSKLWPKKIDIVAEPNPQAENGVSFRMEDEKGRELETLVFSKDNEPGMKKDDKHEVRFRLVQESGMTLEFAQSPSDALWVAWGTEDTYPPCPQTKPSQPDSIFFAEKSNGNTLVAVNTNPARCRFSFTLNFVDPHSQTPSKLIPFDPGGGNEDGGLPFIDFAWAPLVTGAIVGLGAILLINNSLAPPNALIFGIGGAIVGLVVGMLFKRM